MFHTVMFLKTEASELSILKDILAEECYSLSMSLEQEDLAIDALEKNLETTTIAKTLMTLRCAELESKINDLKVQSLSFQEDKEKLNTILRRMTLDLREQTERANRAVSELADTKKTNDILYTRLALNSHIEQCGSEVLKLLKTVPEIFKLNCNPK